MTAPDLAHQKCKPCEGGVAPLRPQEVTRLLQQLDGLEYRDGVITKTYEFRNYYQTMAFVNGAAWMSALVSPLATQSGNQPRTNIVIGAVAHVYIPST